MVSILAISGSLRSASSNTALLETARCLAPDDVEITIYGGLGGLPHFNPDLDGDHVPPSVQELRTAVDRAGAILISSPEYAHGIAGVMKNLLDWLVASVEFPGKPVGILNASPRSFHADAALKEVLTTMSAKLVPGACIAVAPGSPDLAEQLERAIRELVRAA